MRTKNYKRRGTAAARNITTRPIHEDGKLLCKVNEAARILGVSPASVRRLINRGELAANRKLRHVLIPRSSIEQFANALTGREASRNELD